MNKIKEKFLFVKSAVNNKIKNFKWSKIKLNFYEFFFFLRKNFRLLLVSVFKSLKIYVYVFIVPLVLMIGLYSYQTMAGTNQPLPPITAGFLLIPGFGLILGINNLISEWKASIFLKRINLVGTTKTQFLCSIWIVGYLLGLISTIFCGGIAIAIAQAFRGSNAFIEMFKFLNHGPSGNVLKSYLGLFLGITTVIFSSIGLSTLISGAFSNIALIQTLGILLLIFTFIFSDLFFNPKIIAIHKSLIIISYFVPQKYSAWTVFYATSAGNSEYFLPIAGTIKSIISFRNLTWPIINSILYCLGLFIVSAFTFKWNNRG